MSESPDAGTMQKTCPRILKTNTQGMGHEQILPATACQGHGDVSDTDLVGSGGSVGGLRPGATIPAH